MKSIHFKSTKEIIQIEVILMELSNFRNSSEKMAPHFNWLELFMDSDCSVTYHPLTVRYIYILDEIQIVPV